MRNFMLAVAMVLLSTFALAQDKVEVYGGIQYRHTDVSQFSNVLGYQADGTYFFTPRFGATVDLSGNFSDGKRAYVYSVGPTVKLFSVGNIDVSSHVLLGWERAEINKFSDSGFAIATGGAVDYNLFKHVAIRAIDLDHIYSIHDGKGVSGFRYSGGIVFKF